MATAFFRLSPRARQEKLRRAKWSVHRNVECVKIVDYIRLYARKITHRYKFVNILHSCNIHFQPYSFHWRRNTRSNLALITRELFTKLNTESAEAKFNRPSRFFRELRGFLRGARDKDNTFFNNELETRLCRERVSSLKFTEDALYSFTEKFTLISFDFTLRFNTRFNKCVDVIFACGSSWKEQWNVNIIRFPTKHSHNLKKTDFTTNIRTFLFPLLIARCNLSRAHDANISRKNTVIARYNYVSTNRSSH